MYQVKFKEWEIGKYNTEDVSQLCHAGYTPLAAALLASRGYTDAFSAEEFIEGSFDLLKDPYGLKDMDKAAARIKKAVKNGEKIAVYGDYDVDGITSTCLTVCCLRELGAVNCEYYIPARIEEGYGLNCEAIDYLVQRGIKLIVTVDCGVTAVSEVEYAKSFGIDVVVTDHHRCQEQLPAAVAVVNPCRQDDTYAFKGLAGVGVAFKLVCALVGTEAAMKYIDLVALGTVADVMPLVDENRVIVKAGLKIMSESPREGLRALINEAGLRKPELDSGDIAFALAPRINAAGRMGEVHVATELFLTPEPERAAALAAELSELNLKRQSIEMEIFNEAKQLLGAREEGGAIVLASEKWHHGVIGIVSSKLAERFRCRVFLISLADGVGKASCRSFRGQSVIAAIEAARDYIEDYGGHEMAAGFTILEENIPAFKLCVEEFARQHKAEDEAGCRLRVDCELEGLELITRENIEGMDPIQPFGQSNPPPVFCVSDVEVSRIFMVGAQKDHMKLTFTKNGRICGGIFFNETQKSTEICTDDIVDIAFSPRINEFRGTKTAQLQMLDMRPCAAERVHMEQLEEQLAAFEEGALAPHEALRLLPERKELVAVWKKTAHMSDSEYTQSLWSFAKSAGVSLGKTLLSLRVFDELGLIKLKRTGRLVKIKTDPSRGKVDLENSALLASLKAAANAQTGRDDN